jgi:hypothetical protein
MSLALTAAVGCRTPTNPGNPGNPGGVSPLCTTTSTEGAPTTGYYAKGPFSTTVTKVGTNTYFHPATMTAGTKLPVILWGNGTSVTPDCYTVLLHHWASYGFIAAAANTTNSGSGREMLAGLDYLTSANGQAGNKFYGVVDLANVGTSGHSQGGGGSIASGRDPRVKTIMPIEGAGGGGFNRTGVTALVLAGDADTLVGTTGPTNFYNGLQVPAALAIARGASHFTVNNSVFRPATTAWALWQLKGDQTAKAQFVGPNCGYCSPAAGFSTYRANARLQAL